MPQIIMKSDEFGEEDFDYDVIEEAQEAFARLKEECQKQAHEDGIERTLFLVLDSWTTGDEDDEE
jgi:hypothetical protein